MLNGLLHLESEELFNKDLALHKKHSYDTVFVLASTAVFLLEKMFTSKMKRCTNIFLKLATIFLGKNKTHKQG